MTWFIQASAAVYLASGLGALLGLLLPSARLLRGAVWGLGLATVIASLEGLHWFLDLAAHFRPHLLVLWLVGSGITLALRSWRFFGATLLVMGWLGWGLVGAPAPPEGPGSVAHLMHVNVQMNAPDHGPLVRQLEDARPDIVSLVEVDEAWMESLTQGLDYPYVESAPRSDFLGLGLMSRHPIRSFDVVDVVPGLPLVHATVEVERSLVPITILHVLPPIRASWARSQAETLALLAKHEPPNPGRWLVCGDFNATPWSAVFRRFASASGLAPASYGGALEGTWPTGMPWARLPIDHCLLGPDLTQRRAYVGGALAGDHLPIHLHFDITVR